MDPFFLTFSSRELEQWYLKYTAESRDLHIDACYWWLAVVIRALALVKFAGKREHSHLAMCYAHLAWLLAEAPLRRALGRRGLWRRREIIVVISRLIHICEFSTSINEPAAEMFQFESPNVSCKSIFFSVLWHGLLPMVFSGVFQPLRFWLHLPLHLLSSAFFLATLNVDLCMATGGASIPGMDPVHDWLDGLAKQVLGILLATRLDDDP
ncbi:unnamed protein product, partial [Ostreobium quekettii]